MNRQKVFIIGSSYGLLVCLLAFQISEKDIFVFNGHIVSERISNELSKANLVYIRHNNALFKNFIRKIQNVRIESQKYKKYTHDNVEKDAIVIGHDHILAVAYPFWGRFKTIIEDGYISYLTYNEIIALMKKKGARYYKLLHLIHKIRTGNDYKLYGYDKSVSKVILTDIQKEVPGLHGKVEYCSIQTLWNGLSQDRKNRLIEIFQITKVNELIKKYKNVRLLITQPLSEDNLMSEKEKIEIYSSILNGENQLILIKPHPREKTNYKEIFPSTVIIDNDIPMEMIALVSDNISEVYTCFSTAAKIFDGKAKIKYISLKNYPDIIDKYNLHDLQTED